MCGNQPGLGPAWPFVKLDLVPAGFFGPIERLIGTFDPGRHIRTGVL